MKLNLPERIRFGLYAFTALGTPVIAYLHEKSYIGAAEVRLWSAEVGAVAVMAAFNVVKRKRRGNDAV